MAILNLKTTKELAESFVNKMVASLDTGAATLEKSFINILGDVSAGAQTTLHKYAGFIFQQMFAETASYEEIKILGYTFRPLVLLGRRLGVEDPRLGVPAIVQVQLTSSAPSGTIQAGTQWLGDNGLIYEAIGGESVTSSFLALVQAVDVGVVGNVSTGTMELIKPLSNLDRSCDIVALASTGTADETEDEYRERVVEAEVSQPQGGAYADYRQWGGSVAGVTGIYPYTGSPGEVDVYVEGGNPPEYIPDAAMLLLVEDAIQNDETGIARSRPQNDAVNVYPITRRSVNVTVAGFTGTADDQTILSQAFDDRLRSRRPFILGLDPLPRRDVISRSDLGGICAEVCASLGVTFNSVTVNITGIGDIVTYNLAAGETANLGSALYP